jgi:hypothetical protein
MQLKTRFEQKKKNRTVSTSNKWLDPFIDDPLLQEYLGSV